MTTTPVLCLPLQYSTKFHFFNGQIVFFVFFSCSHWRTKIIKWFIACLLILRLIARKIFENLCIYLQLSLFLWHCYLYKILIFRLAIRVHLVPEVWMRLKDRRSLTFAVVSVEWVLMLKIDPYSSWPIWILLLGIDSLHKPRIPQREKWRKKRRKETTTKKMMKLI